MKFFLKKNKKEVVSLAEENDLINDFYVPSFENKKKSSILDVIEPKRNSDDQLTNALLNGLIEFKERTPELNHYRKEILELLNSDEGETIFFEHLSNNSNKK